MAKFRRNHNKTKNSGFGSLFVRVLVFMFFIGVSFVWLYRMMEKVNNPFVDHQTLSLGETRNFLPSSCIGQLINHTYYSTCYNEEYELANWVAYALKKEYVTKRSVSRSKKYRIDPNVISKSAKHGDYTHSGYTRGHLVPAGDMAFDELAMKESFFMSNMTPQVRGFNNGIWKELEENTRNWAKRRKLIYIISGPIISEQAETIGYNEIAVPNSFYKILLDPNRLETISFLIPHEVSKKALKDYIVSIDQLEALTSIDFFSLLLDDEQEIELEAKKAIGSWKFDQNKYNQRVSVWNQQK